MRQVIVKAWTGGSSPKPLSTIGLREHFYAKILFREQMKEHVRYWGDCEWETARTFWNRARHDAHATFRE